MPKPQIVWTIAIVAMLAGCARLDYRIRADFDAYRLIHEKSSCTPWSPPADYSVYPAPESRLNTPTSPDDPALPIPAPVLYGYAVPLANRSVAAVDASLESPTDESVEPTGNGQPLVIPIPATAWAEIPSNCRQQMFEFASLRREAELTEASFDASILTAVEQDIPRLTLRDIVDLSILNSREYQQQKESLYRVALQLSLERFDYQLKPTLGGSGADAAANHNRNGGATVNSLSVPSTASVDKMLVTGGDLLARFANSILLTFSGPQGFSADVSSELLFEYSQPLLQRDIVLEGLTQAERNLVYAARDFARFRKQFFVNFAQQYYNLIRSFRQVEIDSQNYFSLVRAFNQAEAEYRAGLVPRFQVDQVEQNLLSGRGNLIGTCNNLEQSLDGLKLNMGLPTETRINLDLSELEQLTLRDQLAVANNLIDRVRQRLSNALTQPEFVELASSGIVLIDRVLDANALREQLDIAPLDPAPFRLLRARIAVESTRQTTREIADSIDEESQSDSPSLPVIFQRCLALNDTMTELVDHQLTVATLTQKPAADVDRIRQQRLALGELASAMREDLQEMIVNEQLQQMPLLVERALELREQGESLVEVADALNGVSAERASEVQRLRDLVAVIGQLMQDTDEFLAGSAGDLALIELDVDEAMISALVSRLDLMNERGFLADEWRQIKFAADDLKSILNLNVSQRVGTVDGSNQPFNFTFDESQTAARLSFDAPFNRRAQRNRFRTSLLDYQAGLRSLMQAEDNIKFDIRSDLRSLALDKEQYEISVASAALAFERVVSTSLEFRLGTGGVSARDYLEAQTAYTGALSSVASRHINYILDRTQLFLDLEQLVLNDDGFWDELYNESFTPQPYFNMPMWALPAYGELPCVKHSECIRRQLWVPPGQPMTFSGTASEPMAGEDLPPPSAPPGAEANPSVGGN